jgi:hypothetical protein
MIARTSINLNNIRNLELDQLAVRALHDPSKRNLLLGRIRPLDEPVRLVMDSIAHYISPKGCETHYTHVPESVMIRRLRGGLGNIIQKGMLEYDRVHKDRRGHFFDLYLGGSLPAGQDDAVLCVSHYTANRWAAEDRLKIVEDVVSEDMNYVDPSMRLYSLNRYDMDGVPDIPIEDIDLIAVAERPDEELDALSATAPRGLQELIRKRIFPVPFSRPDSSINIFSFAGNILSEMGCIPRNQKYLLKDPSAILFWEIQKFCAFPDMDSWHVTRTLPQSVEAMRRVISADPELWGKTGAGYFDPLGIINYMMSNGKHIG